MTAEANNSPNPEQNTAVVEFAGEEQIRATFAQLESLYLHAQNPAFARSLPGFRVSFDGEDHGAKYRFEDRRGAVGGHNELSIQMREDSVIVLKQESTVPLAYGKRCGNRTITINDQGEIIASKQSSEDMYSRGIRGKSEPIQGSQFSEKFNGLVPVSYLNDLQEFVDEVWKVPTSAALGRIMTQ